MSNAEIQKKLKNDRERLLNLKEIYNRSIVDLQGYGYFINSKVVKKNGLHLLSIANEMYKLETEINLLEQIDSKTLNLKNINL